MDQLDLTSKCYSEDYSFSPIAPGAETAAYDALLAETYTALGFLNDKVFPQAEAERHALRFRGTLAGICCLTAVTDSDAVYYRLIPELRERAQRPRLLELNNFVLRPEYRGTIALAIMISGAALRTAARGFDYLVGTTRYQALPYFVEFGVIPVEHEPIHLLGTRKLRDFVIYYDTHSPDSMTYLEQRTRRYVHQVRVMTAIREKYIRRTEAPIADNGTELAG